MILTLGCAAMPLRGELEPDVVERFTAGLGKGWHWLGADDGETRFVQGRLGIRTPPAGIFGEDRQVTNLLLRDLPPHTEKALCVEVMLYAHPEYLYENAGLILFADLDNYAVVTVEAFPGYHEPPTVLRVFSERNQELVDDSIKPLSEELLMPLRLRLRIEGDSVAGFGASKLGDAWFEVGSTSVPDGSSLSVGIQTGYGDPDAERWAD